MHCHALKHWYIAALQCTETLIHWSADSALRYTAMICCSAVNFGTSLECALHWWWERLGLKGNRQEARLHLMNRFKTDEDWTGGWFGRWQIQNTQIKFKEPKLANIKFYYIHYFVSCTLTDMGVGHVQGDFFNWSRPKSSKCWRRQNPYQKSESKGVSHRTYENLTQTFTF